ncbi:MAG: hypothetical protein EHM47_16615 [Ignavibacteriales bacterium]|nr:MAG: hypothetical protein EHM47_16615 [Ignavibacteriales bacterium]
MYFRKTEPFFTRYVYDEIVNTLRLYSAGQEFHGEKIYNYLKAYLLLGDERSKLDTNTQRFLTGTFTGILNSKFINTNSNVPPAGKDSLKNLFRNHISYFIEQMKENNIYPVRNDIMLLSSVRARFQNKPNAESIYARMKESGMSQYTELTFDQLIEGKSGQVMSTNFSIPYVFTSDGWKNYFYPAILNESVNPGKEDWVMGKSQFQQSSLSEFDSEKMKNQLTDLYTKDFMQTWIQFLQSIRYSGFQSAPYAANSMKLLSDPVNSPLIIILKLFAEQTKSISGTQPGATETGQPVLPSLNITDTKRFGKFILGSEDGSTPPDLNIVIMQYGILNGSLEGIKDGEDLIKDYAVKVLTQQAVEFQTSLKSIQGVIFNVPEFKNLLIEPVKMSWRSVLSGASSYLNTQWKSKVSDTYKKTLAGAFPFSEKGSDVPIQDFDEFFNPQSGILWTFFNSELSPFIKKETWKISSWENEGLSISRDFINSMKKADEISSIMFRDGKMDLTFRLKPLFPPESKTVSGKKATVVQYYLKINDIAETYGMGSPTETSYSWPNNQVQGANLYITLDEFGASDPISYFGEWAFFRLLNRANILRGESSSQVILKWNFAKPNLYDATIGYTLNAKSSRHPFSQNFFKAFKMPDTIN